MATPLKSVLVTDWSRQHIAGHDLDGGAPVSFDLDTTVVGTEALGYDLTQWSAGDIATLKLDPRTQLARLRIVTPKSYIVRVREFQIVDIAHITDETSSSVGTTPADCGRHIFLKGAAENGTAYIMPMLGYTAWEQPWDLTSLEDALKKAAARTPQGDESATHISWRITQEMIGSGDERLKMLAECYGKIFYPHSKCAGTVFDRVTSLTVTSMAVDQTGPATRAHMYMAAFVKKTKESAVPGTHEYRHEKTGTAFSQPYFTVDGEKVFIRTSAVRPEKAE